MGYIPIQWKAFGLLSSVLGTDHIITIQQDTRPCISQRRAISIITEKLICLESFSGSCGNERT